MSLVITSNIGNLDGNDAIMNGINLPYNYHNYLSQPLELDANSEVAVQSVKIVKVGNSAIDMSNNTFYTYQGKDDANSTFTNGDFDIDLTTSQMVRAQIGTAKRTEVNSEELAKLIQDSLTRSLCNPNLVESDFNSSGVEVVTERESGSSDFGKFLGFDIKFHQKTSASNTDTKTNMAFQNLLDRDEFNGSWNSASHTITKTIADDDCEMIATIPLSNCSGSFKFSFKDAGGLWEVGLTRWKDYLSGEKYRQNPSYFDDFDDPEDYEFIDWVAKSVINASNKYELRLYHSVNEGNTNQSTILLKEFEYWNGGPASSGLSAPIEIFTENASYGTTNISELEFFVKNERMGVKVQSSDGSSASHTLADGAQANKLHNLKPVNICTRFMYPEVKVREHNKFITIQTYNGVTPTKWNYLLQHPQHIPADLNLTQVGLDYQLDMDAPQYDFWARIIDTDNEEEFGADADCRYMFDFDDASAYTQLGLNASDTLDTEIVLCLAEDDDFAPSRGANAQRLMGFPNTPLLRKSLRNTDTPLLYQYISNSIPVQFSKGSVFVSLNNFTQQSYNGQTSQPSKILYHLPRFDNSGGDTGALFFEPSEKTYVKLNNTHKLVINDFELSLVNADNRLADNLTGKTIICLHFRKSLN